MPSSDIDVGVLRHNLGRVLGDPQLHLPSNVLVLDTETSALNPAMPDAHAWQIGLYPVRDGKHLCPTGESIYLQWPVPMLKQATFEIDRRRAIATSTGNTRSQSERVKDGAYYKCEQEFVDEVYSNGMPPKDAYMYATSIIESFVNNGYVLAGQNFTRFDIPFLQSDCKYLGLPLIKFPVNKLVDVGMLLKSSLISKRIGNDETCLDFYSRIANIRAKGIYYSLEKCNTRWGLAAKYSLDMDCVHGAGFDCKLTHCCLQELVNEVLDREVISNEMPKM